MSGKEDVPPEIKALLAAGVELIKAITRWFDRKDVK
jgi:hypothetical protein